MNILKLLNEILVGGDTGASYIFAGTADSTAEDKVVVYNQVPGEGANFGSSVANYNIQIDVYARDIYDGYDIKEKIIKILVGLADLYDGTPVIFKLQNDLGCIYDDDANFWHFIIQIAVKATR